MASDGTGTAWPSAVPPDTLLVGDVPVEIRDLRAGAGTRIGKEHLAPAAAGVGGEHTKGSAKAYFQDDFPTTRPDGDTLLDDSTDGGRLLVRPGSGGLYYWDESSSTFKQIVVDGTTIPDASIPGEKLQKGSIGIAMPYAIIQEVRATATAGGTFTQDAWTTRTLNTIISDVEAIIVSLSSNAVKVSAGRYRIRASSPANQCNGHQIRIYNVTRSTVLAYGTSQFSGQTSGTNGRSEAVMEFFISEATTFRIEHRCQATKTSNGLGAPCTTGASEVYSCFEIWRL